MNWNLVKGYVLVVLSGLILFAAVVLIVVQWDLTADFSIYASKSTKVSTLLLVVCSAAGGVALLFLLKMMVRGISALRRGHRDSQQRQTRQRLQRLEKQTQAGQQ